MILTSDKDFSLYKTSSFVKPFGRFKVKFIISLSSSSDSISTFIILMPDFPIEEATSPSFPGLLSICMVTSGDECDFLIKTFSNFLKKTSVKNTMPEATTAAE